MSDRRYTFQYQVQGDDAWRPKVEVWKTETGARNAANRLRDDMAAENCVVDTRVGYIEIANGAGRFVTLEA